jgi:hypothetical protein
MLVEMKLVRSSISNMGSGPGLVDAEVLAFVARVPEEGDVVVRAGRDIGHRDGNEALAWVKARSEHRVCSGHR